MPIQEFKGWRGLWPHPLYADDTVGVRQWHFSRYIYLDRSTRQEIDYSFLQQIIHRISSMPGM